jgi:acyl-CoA reductase-like NAD-dependent aldehyde dehydrogenase
MTIINSLLPSLLAGNSVILKPSPQTPSPAERFQSTFLSASLPPSVLQVVHLSFPMTEKLVADPRVGYVSFTGSVKGGRAVAESVAKGKGFKGVGLELGGKDAAFVRSDVDVDWAAEELVDGQSRSCSILSS